MWIPYNQVHRYLQAIYFTYLFILVAIGIFAIGQRVMIHRKLSLPHMWIGVCIVLLTFTILVILYGNHRLVENGIANQSILMDFENVPFIWYVIYCVVVRAILYYDLRKLHHLRKSEITNESIKEAMDNIPSGICIYNRSGMILLSNYRMNQLHEELTSEGLQNGRLFWNRLREEYQIKKKNIEVKMLDGTIWNFRRFTYQENGEVIYKITATNVTELYNLTNDLIAKNNALRIMHQSLLKYEKDVDEVTKAKERLEVKRRVHNQLGHLLLQTQRVLSDDSLKNEKQNLLEEWQVHASVFLNRDEPSENHSVKQLMDSAHAIGLELVIEGDVPSDSELLAIFMEAAAEAITNAVRHAHAKKMKIQCQTMRDSYEVVFTNDGDGPQGEIVLGGGLTNLQKRVESMGGVFSVRSMPEFGLHIRLPMIEGS